MRVPSFLRKPRPPAEIGWQPWSTAEFADAVRKAFPRELVEVDYTAICCIVGLTHQAKDPEND